MKIPSIRPIRKLNCKISTFLIGAACAAFLIDQIIKMLILIYLDMQKLQTYPIFPPYLSIVLVWNEGVNFGLLGSIGGRWLLVVFALGVSILLAVWVQSAHSWVLPIAVGLLIGGALGNATDRIIYGAVVDYLNMSCCRLRNPYSFNFADIFIFVGIGVVFLDYRKR